MRSFSNFPESKYEKKSSSRNAFLQFLHHYRQTTKSKKPASVIATDAGKLWGRMSLNDKCCYIEAARNAAYVYKSRDRRLNRVMRHIRGALKSEERMDLIQLSTAVKEMQLWKRRVLSSMCIW